MYDCYKIEVKLKDDVDYKDLYVILFIDKTSFLPVRKIFHAEFQQTHQYDDLRLSDIKINEAEATKRLKEPMIPESYKTEYYKESDYKRPPLLSSGGSAPDFELPVINGDKTITLSSLKGKVVLLDFWYISCRPCKKALPHLEALHQKYKNKGLMVIGINPRGSDISNKDELIAYLKKQNVTYTNVSDLKQITTESYQVHAYPSMYIIGKNGTIIFNHEGFGEQLTDTLETVITAALK